MRIYLISLVFLVGCFYAQSASVRNEKKNSLEDIIKSFEKIKPGLKSRSLDEIIKSFANLRPGLKSKRSIEDIIKSFEEMPPKVSKRFITELYYGLQNKLGGLYKGAAEAVFGENKYIDGYFDFMGNVFGTMEKVSGQVESAAIDYVLNQLKNGTFNGTTNATSEQTPEQTKRFVTELYYGLQNKLGGLYKGAAEAVFGQNKYIDGYFDFMGNVFGTMEKVSGQVESAAIDYVLNQLKNGTTNATSEQTPEETKRFITDIYYGLQNKIGGLYKGAAEAVFGQNKYIDGYFDFMGNVFGTMEKVSGQVESAAIDYVLNQLKNGTFNGTTNATTEQTPEQTKRFITELYYGLQNKLGGLYKSGAEAVFGQNKYIDGYFDFMGNVFGTMEKVSGQVESAAIDYVLNQLKNGTFNGTTNVTSEQTPEQTKRFVTELYYGLQNKLGGLYKGAAEAVFGQNKYIDGYFDFMGNVFGTMEKVSGQVESAAIDYVLNQLKNGTTNGTAESEPVAIEKRFFTDIYYGLQNKIGGLYKSAAEAIFGPSEAIDSYFNFVDNLMGATQDISNKYVEPYLVEQITGKREVDTVFLEELKKKLIDVYNNVN